MSKLKSPKSWQKILQSEFDQPYFQELTKFLKKECADQSIFPEETNIFRAFELCPLNKIKVVILGQDPYHGQGQANGLAFSVNYQVKLPPSLQNIYKEMATDLNIPKPQQGDLSNWAKQGVLLLNSTLTVQANKPGSHQNLGWEQFTNNIINQISQKKDHLVFILWGNYAQAKGQMINSSKHLILMSPHPSPFSANKGFFGSQPFTKTNYYLKLHNKKPIDWAL